MRVLFCNIAWMKFYRGKMVGFDEPISSAEYVRLFGEGHEQYNFDTVSLDDGVEVCLGYFSTKSMDGQKDNKLHIERIEGVSSEADFAKNVLVIWCAPQYTTDKRTVVVGWYKNATVFREYQDMEFDEGYIQYYNVLANADDCVLLPFAERNRYCWNVPRKHKKGAAFGFGQANQWYASEEKAQPFIAKLIEQINIYSGTNDMYTEI